MITGDKERLDEIAKTHVCTEHQTPVVVAWHAGENGYVLRCGQGHFPEEVTRQLSPTRQYKAGKLELIGKGLDLMPKADLATGELLTPEEVQGIISYATKYGLDAYRGHVVLMYSKPYFTIDAYLFYASKQGEPYQLKSRPLNDDERKVYRLEGENDHAWLAEVVKLNSELFTGLGIVTETEMTATSKRDKTKLASPVVAAHPQLLAQKRAEWQALRRAFPLGITEEESNEQPG